MERTGRSTSFNTGNPTSRKGHELNEHNRQRAAIARISAGALMLPGGGYLQSSAHRLHKHFSIERLGEKSSGALFKSFRSHRFICMRRDEQDRRLGLELLHGS